MIINMTLKVLAYAIKQGKGNNIKQSNPVFRNLDISSAWNPTLGNS